jgi:hypothetical protein
MNWVSLGPGQVAALWAAAAGAALWLYRRSRQPVKRQVSSLRFWVSDAALPPSRRLLREPWALLAQLLFLLLAILALADVRLGDEFEQRKVAIIVDTSVWSQVQPPRQPSGIERARQEAEAFLAALPAGNRVLLLRADADVTVVLPFTDDRAALRRSIATLQPSSGVADVPRAVAMAGAALSGSRRGVVVYIGPGMIENRQIAELNEVRKSFQVGNRRGGQTEFLVRLVKGAAPGQNRGIVGIALQRDSAHPEQWHVLTRIRNYSQTAAKLMLTLTVDGQRLGQRSVALGPGQSAGVRDDLVVSQSGLLTAEITPGDWLAADDRADVFIPPFLPTRVQVITANPSFANKLRGVLDANSYVRTDWVRPDESAAAAADVAIHEGVPVPDRPAPNSIWFVGGVRTVTTTPAESLRVASWNAQHPVTRWVHTRDVSVRHAASLQTQPTDTVVASGAGGEPLILARDRDGSKALIIGFDPRDSNFSEQAAFPLLMAGALEWMTRSVADTVVPLLTGDVDVPGPVTRVIAPSNQDVPFARDGRFVHVRALEAGVYRLSEPGGERLLPVNVPALPAEVLKPASEELAALEPEARQARSGQLWRWLVALSLVAVWTEWLLFSSAK